MRENKEIKKVSIDIFSAKQTCGTKVLKPTHRHTKSRKKKPLTKSPKRTEKLMRRRTVARSWFLSEKLDGSSSFHHAFFMFGFLRDSTCDGTSPTCNHCGRLERRLLEAIPKMWMPCGLICVMLWDIHCIQQAGFVWNLSFSPYVVALKTQKNPNHTNSCCFMEKGQEMPNHKRCFLLQIPSCNIVCNMPSGQQLNTCSSVNCSSAQQVENKHGNSRVSDIKLLKKVRKLWEKNSR